jgi:hypothetical protein
LRVAGGNTSLCICLLHESIDGIGFVRSVYEVARVYGDERA